MPDSALLRVRRGNKNFGKFLYFLCERFYSVGFNAVIVAD
jgi:hypothetical protein